MNPGKDRARSAPPADAHAETEGGNHGESQAEVGLDTHEDQILAAIKQAAITPAGLEKIAKDPGTVRSRKVRLALVEHPRTPRHLSLVLMRELLSFDLMRVAWQPAVSAELKRAAEEALIRRLDKLSLGEKLSLARRASPRVVAALAGEAEARIVNAVLESPRLTSSSLVNALLRRDSSDLLDQSVRGHSKWSICPEVQQALRRRAERAIAEPD